MFDLLKDMTRWTAKHGPAIVLQLLPLDEDDAEQTRAVTDGQAQACGSRLP